MLTEGLEPRILLAFDALAGEAPDNPGGGSFYTHSAAEGEVTLGPGTASLHGQKYEDLNGNGLQDANEPGLNGWSILLLDVNGNVVGEQATHDMDLDQSGNIDPVTERGWYWFEDVLPGGYIVREVLKDGWWQTAPASGVYTVTLDAEEAIEDLDFGNTVPGSIHGTKFEDLNVNGVRDDGERPIPGVTILVVGYDPADTAGANPLDQQQTQTDRNGEYWFTKLQPGLEYVVTEVAPWGSVQTTDNPPRLLITSGKEWVATFDQGIDVLNSVEIPWWLDVQIQPVNSDTPVQLMPAGEVMITFGDPASLNPSNAGRTFPIVDAEGLPLEVPKQGGPWLIPFTLHEAVMADDQTGATMRVSGSGRLAVERVGDELRTLTRGDDFFVDSFFDVFFDITVTDVDTGEPMRLTLDDPARPVRVPLEFPMEMMPDDMPFIRTDDVRWMPAMFWASGLGRELLDDAGRLWDRLVSIHAVPHGEPIRPIRIMQEPLLAFGNAFRGSIHGYKFEDLNGNGQWERGEPGLEGVEIVLSMLDPATGNMVSVTTTTNDRGEYWFTQLTPGLTYTVTEVAPDGMSQTTVNPEPLFISSGKEWVATPRQGLDVLNSVEVPWWLEIEIQPVNSPIPTILMPAGDVMFQFSEPQSLNPDTPNATFDIVDPENGLPLEVPEQGGPWLIPFTLHDAEMLDDRTGTALRVSGQGQIAVQRVRDQLVTLSPTQFNVDSFFDVFFEIEIPSDDPDVDPMTLSLADPGRPVRIPLRFPMQMMPDDMPFIRADDVRWMPAMFWATGLGRELLDEAGELWDRLISIHAIPHGEPIRPVRIMEEPLLAFGNIFGNQEGKLTTISGYKFLDLDGDGQFFEDVPTERGLSDWEIILRDANGQIVDRTFTATDDPATTEVETGFWAFHNVPAGQHTISEVQQTGWEQTFPLNNQPHVIDVDPESVYINTMFGNRRSQLPVRIRLQASDESGQAISSIEVGNQFFLEGYVEDLRSTPLGVFSAYLDVLYDSTLVSLDGPVQFSGPYQDGQSGDLTVPGLLDEVGAFDGVTPLGAGEMLLFRVPGTAKALGQADFHPNKAEGFDHEVLLYQQSTALPPSSIEFVGTSFDMIGGAPWQNAVEPTDVDASGNTTPLDALLWINEENVPKYHNRENGQLTLPKPPQASFLDVDGDGLFKLRDLIRVINKLNGVAEAPSQSAAEGESIAGAAPMSVGLTATPAASTDSVGPSSQIIVIASVADDSRVDTANGVAGGEREESSAQPVWPAQEDARDESALADDGDVALESQHDWLLSTEFHDLEESLSEIAEDIASVFGT